MSVHVGFCIQQMDSDLFAFAAGRGRGKITFAVLNVLTKANEMRSDGNLSWKQRATVA